MSSIKHSEFTIALVEDDQFDADFFMRVLNSMNFEGKIQRFVFGEELLDHLKKAYSTNGYKVPDLIFLDIGLPRLNGKEVLRALRDHPKSRTIPIIMLSGSNSKRDFTESVTMGCNGYLIKSHERKKFSELCTGFISSWMQASQQQFM